MFSAENSTPPVLHPNFGVFSKTRFPVLGLRGAKANYLCNYFRTNPTHTPTMLQRHGQADRQTGGRTTYTVHRAVEKQK